MAGFDAGTIEAKATLDRSPFERDLRAAQQQARDFERNPITARLELRGGAEALAQLAALRAEAEALSGSLNDVNVPHGTGSGGQSPLRRIAQDARGARQEAGLLKNAIMGLAPGLVPIAGWAAAGAAGFAGMGAAGIAAFMGIKSEVDKNTALGRQYLTQVNDIKAAWAGVTSQVAKAASPAILSAMQNGGTALPSISPFLSKYAATGADALGNVVNGLIGGFKNFDPVITDVLNGVDRVSQKFEAWASGPGGEKFAQALKSDWDAVKGPLGEIVSLVGRLIAAANGPGLGVVSMFGNLAKVLNAIPLPVLTALISLISVAKTASLVRDLTGTLGLTSTAAGETGLITRLQGSSSALGRRAGGVLAAGAKALPWIMGGQIIGGMISSHYSGDYSSPYGQTISGGGQVARALGDLASLNVGGLISDLSPSKLLGEDKAKEAQDKLKKSASEAYAAYLEGVGQAGNKTLSEVFAGNVAPASTSNLAKTRAEEAATTASTLKPFNQQQTSFQASIKNTTDLAQLSQAYSANADAIQKAAIAQDNYLQGGAKTGVVIDGIKVSVQAWKDAMDATGQDQDKAVGKIRGEIDALNQQNHAYNENIVAMRHVNELQTAATKATGASADQLTMYEQILGITSSQLASMSTDQFVAGMKAVDQATKNGNTAVISFLNAIATFNASGKTAADVGTMIGQTLMAANGDALSFATAMNNSAVANQNVVTALSQTKKGVIDLKTGTIDYNNAAAGPLINALNQLQSSAMSAAAAQYQHEVQTKGSARAAKDAYNTYVNQTQGALVDEAQHLGMTAKQAQKFANEYFGIANAKDVKKSITMFATDKTHNTNVLLGDIANQLQNLTLRTWELNLGSNANQVIGALRSVGSVAAGVVSTINAVSSVGSGIAGAFGGKASGGGLPEGVSAVGERGPELAVKRGNRVDILSNQQSKNFLALTGMTAPGFADGTVPGITNPFTGVDYGTGSSPFSGGSSGSSGGSRSSSSGAKKEDPLLTRWYHWNRHYYQGLPALHAAEAAWKSRNAGVGGRVVEVGSGKYAGWGWNGQAFTSRHDAVNARSDGITEAKEQRKQDQQQYREQDKYYKVGSVYTQGLQATADQRAALRSSRAGGAGIYAGKAGGDTGYAFAGQGYDTLAEARNARVNAFTDVVSQANAAVRGMSAGTLANLARGDTSSVKSYLQDLRSQLSSWAKEVGGVSKSATARINRDVAAINSLTSARDKLKNQLGTSTKATETLYEKQTDLVNKLNEEKNTLADLRQQLKDYASQVAQGWTQGSGFNITTSGNGYAYGIEASLKQQIQDATKFKSLADRAQSMGLSADIINQFESQGQQGAANLQAIVSGGSAYVKRINTEYAQLGSVATSLGSQAAADNVDLKKQITEQNKTIAETNGQLLKVNNEIKTTSAKIAKLNGEIDSKLGDVRTQVSHIDTRLKNQLTNARKA